MNKANSFSDLTEQPIVETDMEKSVMRFMKEEM